jgi:hypothetical protein
VGNRVVRHIVSLAAGVLVTLGWIGDGDSEKFADVAAEVIGGVMLLWSIYASHKDDKNREAK